MKQGFRNIIAAAVSVMAATFIGSISYAAERVALVIGNGKYTNAGGLKNPTNDAIDVANALRKLNFKVILGTDSNYNEMQKLIQEFSAEVANAEVATFYYAGHGLSVGGENYLLPIDAKLNRKTDLDFQSISLSLIQRQMEQSASTRLIFLDACRNNPLTRSWTSASRSAASRGLSSPAGKTKGTYIAFATEPGNVALDGEGTRNSPFSAAFLKHISSPGLELASLMKRVRRDVTIATKDQQIPWSNSGLIGDFYFNTKQVVHADPMAAFRKEQAAWQAVSTTQEAAALEAFVKEYPKGNFVGIARDRLKFLSKSEESQTALLTPSAIEPDRNRNKTAPVTRAVMQCDRLAASDWDSDAIFWEVGLGIRKENAKEAIRACRAAIAQFPNDLTLRFQLGSVLALNDESQIQAAKEMKHAADGGYPAAKNRYANMLRYGRGAKKNETKALVELREAALQGDMLALGNLASYYESTNTGVRDLRKSRIYKKRMVSRLREKAKQRQDPAAMKELSFAYSRGWGVQKDLRTARHYYQKAEAIYLKKSDSGHIGAMLGLGGLYSYSYSFSYFPDRSIAKRKAKMVWETAASLGSLDAKEELKRLSSWK